LQAGDWIVEYAVHRVKSSSDFLAQRQQSTTGTLVVVRGGARVRVLLPSGTLGVVLTD
jgi:hypothetical protein